VTGRKPPREPAERTIHNRIAGFKPDQATPDRSPFAVTNATAVSVLVAELSVAAVSVIFTRLFDIRELLSSLIWRRITFNSLALGLPLLSVQNGTPSDERHL